jgi:hypothetical protein
MFCQGAYAATTGNSANVYVNSSGQIMRNSSSKRYKKDIKDLEINTSLIYKLRPVSYIGKSDNKPYFGLIAEEVAQVIPELAEFAREKDVVPGSNSDKMIPDAVKYPMLSVLLLKEMQKHQAKIEELSEKVNSLLKENSILKSQVSSIEQLQNENKYLKTEIEKIKQLLNVTAKK